MLQPQCSALHHTYSPLKQGQERGTGDTAQLRLQASVATVGAGGDFPALVAWASEIYWSRFSPSACSHLWTAQMFGAASLVFPSPAHLCCLPCSPEGALLRLHRTRHSLGKTSLRKTCHRLPGPLHSHILHLQILAGWERSEPASGHPAPASLILLEGAGPDEAVVPTVRVSRLSFSQKNYPGSLHTSLMTPIPLPSA